MLSTSVGVPFLIAGFGIMGGFFAVLNAVAWPRFYGRTNLGSITGKIMSFLILASALAPSVFSLSLSTFGSYHLVGYLGLFFLDRACSIPDGALSECEWIKSAPRS